GCACSGAGASASPASSHDQGPDVHCGRSRVLRMGIHLVAAATTSFRMASLGAAGGRRSVCLSTHPLSGDATRGGVSASPLPRDGPVADQQLENDAQGRADQGSADPRTAPLRGGPARGTSRSLSGTGTDDGGTQEDDQSIDDAASCGAALQYDARPRGFVAERPANDHSRTSL